jgi:hypothetical protein
MKNLCIFQKKKKKNIRVRVLTFIFLYKLTIQSQKKINFSKPLQPKYCKERATVVTQFWPVSFQFNFKRGLKCKIKRLKIYFDKKCDLSLARKLKTTMCFCHFIFIFNIMIVIRFQI